MPRVEVSPGKPGTLVVKFEYHAGAVAAIKRVPGRQWNPDGMYWTVPDSPEARKVVGEIAAMPRAGAGQVIAVKPKVVGAQSPKPRVRFRPGKDTPLTLNPPHPLIKKVDDELVLRGMAYTTRKSYGQHLRNYFNWLKDRARGGEIEPEKVGAEDIRAYLVQMATSGLVSASYCRGARTVLIYLYETVLKQSGKVCELPRMKRPERLPVVLSREEVARLFKVTHNLKHKALLTPALA